MSDLLPCPFCGNSDGVEVVAEGFAPWVKCHTCGADGPDIYEAEERTPSRDEAVAVWNHRPANERIAELETQRTELQAANTREVERRREAERERDALKTAMSIHNWTHPAEECDEPDCDHVTRRTCEGAEKVTKFLRETLRKRTELLCKADPEWEKRASENVLRAVFGDDWRDQFATAKEPTA